MMPVRFPTLISFAVTVALVTIATGGVDVPALGARLPVSTSPPVPVTPSAAPVPTPVPILQGKIAFTRTCPLWPCDTSADGVYIMRGDGSEQKRLTAGWGPAWSSDGRRLAYAMSSPDNQSTEIYIMNADGSGQTRLTFTPEDEGSPAWSSHGALITFTRSPEGGAPSLWVMNSDGSNERMLAGEGWIHPPEWSPTEDAIAYVCYCRSAGGLYVADIFVMSADGGTPLKLTDGPADNLMPAWSPDGSRIAYLRDGDGTYPDGEAEIWAMDADGGNKTRLTDNLDWDENPTWSPDGSKVAFLRILDHGADIFTMNAAGSEEHNLTDTSDEEAEPAWSPDGSRIAFVRALPDSRNADIFTMYADGTGETRLTTTPDVDSVPTWQPPLGAINGDTDCDGAPDAVDALFVLRHVAGLGDSACIAAGNVKCDDALTAVDSLFILRYVAQLPVSLPPGCPEIGEAG